MTQSAPNGRETLRTLVLRKRQERHLSHDQLIEAFRGQLEKIRGRPIKLSSAKITLEEALDGQRGLSSITRTALSVALNCDPEEIRVLSRRRGTLSAQLIQENVDNSAIVRDQESRIRIYKTWRDSYSLILTAESDLILVDTWFNDGNYFRPLIKERALRLGGKPLKVKIYLLADHFFGGQRLGEIDNLSTTERRERATANESLYRTVFQGGIGEARTAFNDPSVQLLLFGYHLMPGIRIMVIDHKRYVFSWFPGGDISNENACFYVEADSAIESEQPAIDCLEKQIEFVRNHSTRVKAGHADASE